MTDKKQEDISYVMNISECSINPYDLPMKVSYNSLKRLIREVLKEEGVINE